MDFVDAENFEAPGKVQHLGDRWRLFQTVAAQRLRKTGQLASQSWPRGRASDCQDLSFPLDGGVLKTQVKAPAPQRISQAPFFIRGKYNKRNRLGFDRPELWYGNLPGGEDFEQQCLKLMVYLVQLVNQQDAR